jgi:hypothetical protein
MDMHVSTETGRRLAHTTGEPMNPEADPTIRVAAKLDFSIAGFQKKESPCRPPDPSSLPPLPSPPLRLWQTRWQTGTDRSVPVREAALGNRITMVGGKKGKTKETVAPLVEVSSEVSL